VAASLAAAMRGVRHEPRPGRPRSIGDEEIERVIGKTLEEQPPDAIHWSTRSMARAIGMSRDQPYLAGLRAEAAPDRGVKLSPHPQFIDKVRDIVGLYPNPPDAAVVLCPDETSQIQALDRSARSCR
jgi:hypothetical protein